MRNACPHCFTGTIVRKVCDGCGHTFGVNLDNLARRKKTVGERLPTQREQNKLRKAVYQTTGADPFNTSIKA